MVTSLLPERLNQSAAAAIRMANEIRGTGFEIFLKVDFNNFPPK